MFTFSAFYPVISIICFLLGWLAAVTPEAYAKERSKKTWNIRVVPLYDYAMITALPASWPNKPAIKEKEEFSYHAVFFPKGEKAGKRKEAISLEAYHGVTLQPAAYANKVFKAVQNACGADNSARQTIGSTETSITFATFCGSPTKTLPGKDGLSRKQGEIVLYRVDYHGNNLYVINHSWRGKAFNPEKKYEKKFPVRLKTISKHADILRSAMYCHRKEPNASCETFKKFF